MDHSDPFQTGVGRTFLTCKETGRLRQVTQDGEAAILRS